MKGIFISPKPTVKVESSTIKSLLKYSFQICLTSSSLDFHHHFNLYFTFSPYLQLLKKILIFIKDFRKRYLNFHWHFACSLSNLCFASLQQSLRLHLQPHFIFSLLLLNQALNFSIPSLSASSTANHVSYPTNRSCTFLHVISILFPTYFLPQPSKHSFHNKSFILFSHCLHFHLYLISFTFLFPFYVLRHIFDFSRICHNSCLESPYKAFKLAIYNSGEKEGRAKKGNKLLALKKDI